MVWIKYSKDLHFDKSALCIGKFEALHLGHKLLIEDICAHKDKGQTIILTINIDREDNLLTQDEKEYLLKDYNIDYVIEIDFDDIKSMIAEEFIESVLIKQLGVIHLACGSDFRFGKDRKGTIQLLRKYMNYSINIVDKICYKEIEISTTRIKKSILAGDLESANDMLGYKFFIRGEVVHGNKIGRTLGIPTANVNWTRDKLMPPNGVYASKIEIGADIYYGMANIGVKPTIAIGYNPLVEVNIFDFTENIYDKIINISLLKFTRSEKKFINIDVLEANLKHDKEEIEEYIKGLVK